MTSTEKAKAAKNKRGINFTAVKKMALILSAAARKWTEKHILQNRLKQAHA